MDRDKLIEIIHRIVITEGLPDTFFHKDAIGIIQYNPTAKMSAEMMQPGLGMVMPPQDVVVEGEGTQDAGGDNAV